jgi:flagellar protein FliS
MMTPSNRRAASAYRSIGIETRAAGHDQHQLVALMYESLLESLNAAIGAMAQRDIASKVSHINKALRILQEGLYANLDLERGGEISANLAAVYDYAGMALTQANMKNDPAKIQEVIAMIKPIAEAWAQIRNDQTGSAG